MSKAYTIDFYKVNQAQYDLIESLSFTSEDQKKFYKHVLISNIIRWGEPAPVSSQLIRKDMKDANIFDLETRGLINISNYSRVNSLSREYLALTLDLFIELGEMPVQEDINSNKLNLFNGKTANAKQQSKLTLEGSKNSIPELIKNGIKAITKTEIRLESLKNYVDAKKLLYLISIKELKEGLITNKTFNKVRGGYYNSYSTYKSVINQNPVKIDNDHWYYSPAYTIQISGRISHIGGGVQNMSREMQDVAFKELIDLHNYDLLASQCNGLIQQFKFCGLDTSWLEKYVLDPQSKYKFAAVVNVSVDCWKKMFISLIMGSGLPKSVTAGIAFSKKSGQLGAILSALDEEFDGDEASIKIAFEHFKLVIQPLKVLIDKWHIYLLNDYILLKGFKGNKGNIFITNATGHRLNITELFILKQKWEAAGTIAHFVLAGQESAFIHHLAVLGDLSGEFRTISNAHDGLVTLGSISEATIKQAGLLSGLNNPILIEKPFI